MIDKNINVGLVVPGWPLSQFPNGIVAYVEALILGFSSNVNPIVLAYSKEDHASSHEIVDLREFEPNKQFYEKIKDFALYKMKNKWTHSTLYKRNLELIAIKIENATKNFSKKLDIIEIEESFGVSGNLVNLTNLPVITRLHGPHFTMREIMSLENQWDYKLRVDYEGVAIARSNGITAPSLDVLQKVREYYNLELPQAKVIANPVQPVSSENKWLYGSTQPPTILFVGRFDAHKGGDLMLEAFRIIAQKNKDIKLRFIGPDRGILINGKYLKFEPFMNQVIPENNIRSRIEFLGHQSSQAIRKYRKESLIAVFPSRYETFGISLLEALAAGMPAITTAVGGIAEIARNGFNVLLAEPCSPESIAENALNLIGNRSLMERLSENAVQDSLLRYSPENIAKQTEKYYREVLASQ